MRLGVWCSQLPACHCPGPAHLAPSSLWHAQISPPRTWKTSGAYPDNRGVTPAQSAMWLIRQRCTSGGTGNFSFRGLKGVSPLPGRNSQLRSDGLSQYFSLTILLQQEMDCSPNIMLMGLYCASVPKAESLYKRGKMGIASRGCGHCAVFSLRPRGPASVGIGCYVVCRQMTQVRKCSEIWVRSSPHWTPGIFCWQSLLCYNKLGYKNKLAFQKWLVQENKDSG